MKKITFITVLLSILIGFSISTYAVSSIYYNDYAVKLSEIGVFKGTGNGFELGREPTRLEGLIMLIRLLGKETEALQLSKETCMFTDVEDWGRGYVNYAYKNGLTKGVGNNLFGTNDKMDGNSYITFLLRSLGYDDSVKVKDFTWSESVGFAKTIGLLEEDLYFKIVSNTFIRDYVAKSSYDALMQTLKNSTSTLMQQLVSSGVMTQTQANKLSIVNDGNTATSTDMVLTSVEIGKLADAVVLISVVGYDESEWTGSGFYTTQDGNLVTNYHVVDGAKTLKITENDGQIYSGNVKIIGYDEDKDIAVLDIDKTVKLYLNTGNSDNVVLGDEVFTIGSPYGLKNTISDGIISSLRDGGIMQISAPISHGNSGGVLLNNKGQAIGITYAGIEAGENLGFAIPINQYINMNKNLQLDLVTFFNLISTVQKPSNVILKQIASDTITVYWDNDETVDYYKVYASDSIDGTYYEISDSDGLSYWLWSSDYCVSINNLKPGFTYFVKVMAVKDRYFSPPSEVKVITITDTFSYDESEPQILRTYGSISLNDNTTYFKDVSMYEDIPPDNLNVAFYFGKSYLETFLKMISDKDGIESEVAEIASDIANYYNKDVSISIVYNEYYYENPTQFNNNKISSVTVIELSTTNKWLVCYAYVRVHFNKTDNTYVAEWAY